MLDKSLLKDDFKAAFDDVFSSALEECVTNMMPGKSEEGAKIAADFASTFVELVSDSLATRMSDAIDAYVKCMSIQGTLITMGSPFTQTAQVISLPMPTLNGKIPMTLGVS
jgi:hypothetical protein